MLAEHCAAEINRRWLELEQLPSLQRMQKLESILERHILATGGNSTYSHLPDFDEHADCMLEQNSRVASAHDGTRGL